MDERIHSYGSSVRWPYSWLMWYSRPRLRFEVVVLGFGIKVRSLHKKSDWGMLPRTLELSFYWNWRPHPSWIAANKHVA
jgi:hypothetical protein